MIRVLGCEMVWGLVDAPKVRGLIEEATGEPCPCSVGRCCPLIPAENPWPVLVVAAKGVPPEP